MGSTAFLLHVLALLTLAASAAILPPLPQQQPLTTATPPGASASPFTTQQHIHSHEPQLMPILAPILANLGFQVLAMAVPSLASPFLTAGSGPLTLFAPSDDSIRSCLSCSTSLLLREHLVPGLFPYVYLSKLALGTKLETTSLGRCLTITSNIVHYKSRNDSILKIFVDGIEITRPDLFNDGSIVIHGLQGFVTPLSPQSCSKDTVPVPIAPHYSDGSGTALVRLMLRDAIVRLREEGYSILALAMRVKYAELSSLQNMTIFAVDDAQIFAGGHSYVTSVRYHIVPNRLLLHADLLKLPAWTTLPTLVRGQDLVITHTSGGDPLGLGLRINYVPIKKADVVYNMKVAIHSVFLPFPHLQPSDLALAVGAVTDDGIFGPSSGVHRAEGSCADPSLVPGGSCYSGPSPAPGVLPVAFGDDGL